MASLFLVMLVGYFSLLPLTEPALAVNDYCS